MVLFCFRTVVSLRQSLSEVLELVPLVSSTLNKFKSYCSVISLTGTAHVSRRRRLPGCGLLVSATRSLMGFILGGEMQVKVAVHSVLGNHGVAEGAFVWTAALRL